MKIFNSVVEFILNIFFPKKCIYCGKTLDYDAKICICCDCIEHALTKENPKRNFEIKFFDTVICATYYTGIIRKSMLKLKFLSITSLAKTFAYLMVIKIKYDFRYLTADIITCVPLSMKRIKSRGYNQSALIAKEISKHLEIPFFHDIIIKTKEIEKLSKLTLAKRRKIVKGIYKANDNYNIIGKNIILIDDIFTTGSTSNECAKVLKLNGAKSVLVATACETLPYYDQINKFFMKENKK